MEFCVGDRVWFPNKAGDMKSYSAVVAYTDGPLYRFEGDQDGVWYSFKKGEAFREEWEVYEYQAGQAHIKAGELLGLRNRLTLMKDAALKRFNEENDDGA